MTQNQIAWFVANENRRHNLAGEGIDTHKAESQRISAHAAASQAGAAHRQANAAEMNAYTNAVNADTNIENAKTNRINAYTNRYSYMLDKNKFAWQREMDYANFNLSGANIIAKFLPGYK